MTKFQRIKSFFAALIIFLLGIDLIVFPNGSSSRVLTLLALALTFSGLNTLAYFFNMARFMVNGRLILFKGLALLDLGLFSVSILSVPNIYILLYLATIHAFAGLVEILRAMESRRVGAGSWKLKFFHGLVDMIIALSCIVFFKKENTIGIVYGFGLIYSAICRMISCFRKTTLTYIQ